MQPNVSIIIPVYNAEEYIYPCVDSILKQSYTDFEVILVDDGSTDSSGQIIDKLSLTDSRLKVFHKQNGGPGSARNVGLEKAIGTFINFVDADDLLSSNFLESYNKVNYLYECVFQGYTDYTQNGCGDKHIYKEMSTESHSFEDVLLYLMREEMIGYTCLKQFRREIINKYQIRFDNRFRYREDFLFTMEYLSHCTKICITEDYGYKYRKDNANSLLHTWFNAEEYIMINNNVYGIIQNTWDDNKKLMSYFNQWYANKQYLGIRGLIRNRRIGKEERKKELMAIANMIRFYRTTNISIPYSNNIVVNTMLKLAWHTRNVVIVHAVMRLFIR